MSALPPTDVGLGSMVSFGFGTNGVRDLVLYQFALRPKIYIPIHQTNAALPTSSLEFKVSSLKRLDAMSVPAERRPEPRWMVDPNDDPVVYDPADERWKKPKDVKISDRCK